MRFKLLARVSRSGAERYFWILNLLSSSTTCDCEKRIRGFLFDFGFPDFPQDDEDVTMWFESSVYGNQIRSQKFKNFFNLLDKFFSYSFGSLIWHIWFNSWTCSDVLWTKDCSLSMPIGSEFDTCDDSAFTGKENFPLSCKFDWRNVELKIGDVAGVKWL